MEKRYRLDWIIRVIALNLILQIAISYKLWLCSDRTFPIISTFKEIPLDFLSAFEYPLFIGLILSLLAIAAKPRFSLFHILFYSLSSTLILQDISRLQPWFYQMFLLLLISSLAYKREKLCLQLLCFACIATYCWSGFHKLNVYFVEDVFPWFFEPLHLDGFLSTKPSLAIVAAIAEIVFGALLVFKASRKWGLYLLIIFHLMILAMLGPLGHNWNLVVWPWNLAMIIIVYLLFAKQIDLWKDFYKNLKTYPLMFSFIGLFGILPVLNLTGHWDDVLSFKMYAGTHAEANIFFFKNEEDCFPNYMKKDIFEEKRQRISIDKWSFKEMQVSPYNAPRILKRIGEHLCNCLSDKENTHFEILTVGRWDRKDEHYVTYPCSEL